MSVSELASPKVSVLMPMRNADRFIADALRSILAETRVAMEVVVVDDGSTDNSRATVEAFGSSKIRIIDGPQKGISAAFNAALQHCRGEIVMRCDADDLYPAGRIARQTRWLEENADFGAVCGAYAAMDPNGRNEVPFKMPTEPAEITDELSNGLVRTHFCTFAVRAAVLKEIGGARPYFVTGEDIDLQLRLGEHCRVWYAPEQTYLYRLHDSSITHTIQIKSRHFYEAQARIFQRQRQETGTDALERAWPVAGPEPSGEVSSAADHLQSLLVGASWGALQAGERRKAIRLSCQAVLARPHSWRGWRTLLAVTVKAVIL